MEAAISDASTHDAAHSPIIVTGATRSGTTLLALMFGHHPDIAHASEIEWLWDFVRDGDEPRLPDYWRWLEVHRSVRYYGLHIDHGLDFRELNRSLLRQLKELHPGPSSREKPLVVCQLHRHYFEALKTFPDARFVHIVRDGRDVCASWIRLGWIGNGYEGGVRWREAMMQWRQVRRLISERQRIELRFRELLADPERELRRLCTFLGVRYDAAMLRYHERSSYGPVDPARAGNWHSTLSERDLQLFESVAADSLIANGYALSGRPLRAVTPLVRISAGLHGKLAHHRGRIRRFGLALWSMDLAGRVLNLRSVRVQAQLGIDAIENAQVRDREGGPL